jgi:putative hemolysin
MPFGWDFEGLDLVADHLIIIDQQPEPKVVATYRLLSSKIARRFYSQSEFKLDDFLSQPGSKLELGRACVHADYRRGLVMALLWQGLGEYAKLCGAEYMFGCSSLKTIDLRETFEVYRLLRTRQQLIEDLGIAPTAKYEMPLLKELVHFSRELSFEDTPTAQKQDVHSLLPTLLEGYLNAGAKVYGRPALDRDFNCVDFFTVLETKNLGRLYEKRFRL